jgi:hypothetical protein
MDVGQTVADRDVVGGVDTHKDLHVAAVVDELDRVLESRCFATTRHGYKQMLTWMRSFGQLRRVGVEATGTYGAGLLRYMQNAGVEVLEVTTPDTHDRRKRGKNDDLDGQNAAHAAFAGRRTVTPKSRDGMVESLRVLKACRKTAVAARRVALQMIHNTIVCAPEDLRETLRKMTRMQLIRTLAAWRPDLTDYRWVGSAYRITLKSLRDAHQPTSLRDGQAAGPPMTDVVAPLRRGAFFSAPLRNSISSAWRPTMRSRAAILASYSWIRSAARASSSKAPASNLATQTRIRLREISWRLARPCKVSPATNSYATCRLNSMLCERCRGMAFIL